MANAAPETRPKVALAVAAHPDDIEFMMGGTLLSLAALGWKTHYITVGNGSVGSRTISAPDIVQTRGLEAKAGAAALGATWHSPVVNDIEIVYCVELLRRLTSVVRLVVPDVILTQAPDDYMDDHIETSRLAASAAFNRCMPNFESFPPRLAFDEDIVVYHAQPHGLHDALRRRVYPGLYVDTAPVQDQKRGALDAHNSQDEWLGSTQGFGSYLRAMDEMSRTVGQMSGMFELAEGWRRHSHLGFSAQDQDPLRDALGDRAHVDAGYERSLLANPYA